MCTFHYFSCYLPDFVTALCLGFIFSFSFLDICFTLPWCRNKPLVDSLFLTRDQTLSPWSGSTDSKTLDTRGQPQGRLTQRKPLGYKTQHHPATSSALCRTPRLSNKQNRSTRPTISRQGDPLTQPCPSEEKQAGKNSAQISPYTKLTQTTWPTLGGKKPNEERIQPSSGKNSTFLEA